MIKKRLYKIKHLKSQEIKDTWLPPEMDLVRSSFPVFTVFGRSESLDENQTTHILSLFLKSDLLCLKHEPSNLDPTVPASD